MARTRTYSPGFALLALVMATACTRSSPTAPSAVLPTATAELDAATARPFRGECETQVAPIGPPPQGTCRVFEQTPWAAYIEVTGTCQITHLGRSTTRAVQQLLFELDSAGQPIFVGGQPVITALRNCAEFTAANGDVLRHVTTGTVVPGPQPGTVAFTGSLTFDGGTGRFAGASGSAAFDGTASLITNTGHLAMEGRLGY